MDSQRWQKIEEAVALASEMPDNERENWLDEFCAGDESIKNEIKSLLAFESRAENFLEKSLTPIAVSLQAENTNSFIGKNFGSYKIIREIGRGGMGAVFLAVRSDDQFNKRVAIKVLRRGMDTEDVLRRFRQERQILAALEHPFIARLLDGGMSDDGLPYFVMEYVEGEPLDRYCDEHNLSTEERLQIFLKVCSAVQFAHQNLIVHRDLKPSNILITKNGEPKLLDFGIAKFLNPELSAQTIAPTATFVRLMTPEYASPEQIRGRNISTASDIYSLGVVLYKILTGYSPYKFENPTLLEIERVVCESEPPAPSRVVSESLNESGNLKKDERKQNLQSLRGDLDNIVLTALRKEPERRYQSVEKFAEDIGKYLQSLPVSARPNTFRYRAGKFIKRNKIAVAAAAFVFFAILSALIVSLWQTENARRQRDIAQVEKAKAERINKFLQEMLSFSNQSFTSVSPVAHSKNVTVNEMLDQITPRIETELADQPEVRAQILRTIGSSYASQGRYEAAEKNLRAALETQMQIYGENNSETADTMFQLGTLFFRQLKLDEAAKLIEKVVAFYRTQHQTNSPFYRASKLAVALDTLGTIEFYKGETKEAVTNLNEALQIAESSNLQGRERLILASAQTDLGGILLRTNESEKGEKLLRQSIAEYRQIPDQAGWEFGATLTMFGESLIGKNQPDEALKVLIEGEQIYRQSIGSDNLYLGLNLYHQAMAFLKKGEFKKAEERGRENLALYQRLNLQNTQSIIVPLTALGSILTKDGRLKEGENYFRQALEINERQTPKNYTLSVQIKSDLSDNLAAQKRLIEAEKIALEAVQESTGNLGEQNPTTKYAASMLNKIYQKQGKK